MTLPRTALDTLALVACDAAYYGPIEGEVSRVAAEQVGKRGKGKDRRSKRTDHADRREGKHQG